MYRRRSISLDAVPRYLTTQSDVLLSLSIPSYYTLIDVFTEKKETFISNYIRSEVEKKPLLVIT